MPFPSLPQPAPSRLQPHRAVYGKEDQYRAALEEAKREFANAQERLQKAVADREDCRRAILALGQLLDEDVEQYRLNLDRRKRNQLEVLFGIESTDKTNTSPPTESTIKSRSKAGSPSTQSSASKRSKDSR